MSKRLLSLMLTACAATSASADAKDRSPVVAQLNGEDVFEDEVLQFCPARGGNTTDIAQEYVVRRLVAAELAGRGQQVSLDSLNSDEALSMLEPAPPVTEEEVERFFREYPALFRAGTSRVIQEVEQTDGRRAPETREFFVGFAEAQFSFQEWRSLGQGESSRPYVRDGKTWIAKCLRTEVRDDLKLNEARAEIRKKLEQSRNTLHFHYLRTKLLKSAIVKIIREVWCPTQPIDSARK